MRFQPALNKTVTERQLKHYKKTKIEKIRSLSLSIFNSKNSISELKSKYVFGPFEKWNQTAGLENLE